MTELAIVQARIPAEDIEQMDTDRAILGLRTRSDAVREGLRLLHRQARYVTLGNQYDAFYGVDVEAIGDLAAIGDQVATASMAQD